MQGRATMISQLELCGIPDRDAFARETRALAALYPWLAIVPGPRAQAATFLIAAQRWRDPGFDPTIVDQEIAEALQAFGAVTLRITDARGTCSPAQLVEVALQVVTRYQRFLIGRNESSAAPIFDRALGLHRALHDRSKPLVAADLDHALDVWRWVLRLDPEAGLAVQLAALFHDVERLVSESDVRVEQHSLDYEGFKRAHAQQGAVMVEQLLLEVGADARLAGTVARLVRDHERPHDDPDKQLLNVADALSFFSLNACGFIAYYGLVHTRRKIDYTLARLDARGHRELRRIRQRADLQRLIEQATASVPAQAALQVQP
jgi:hypothetical protein